ncbi:MAG: hypothetical protein GY707_05285 [Desulfobacteraceae bacterium]|nr:hypothetical protein [Desulfobacteraceae bacterium]
MKLLRYNFSDIYKCSSYYKTNAKGTVWLTTYIHKREWQKFFEHGRRKILDTTRWCNYMFNFQVVLDSELNVTQKAVIIKLASLREFSDFNLYGDSSIDLKRAVESIPLEYIESIPLIQIKNDKIKLIFEENK